jgi:Zn-dependent protease/predicted transcriptional regulator
MDLSWLVIFALVVWSLAGGVFPSRYEGLHWSVYLAMGLAGAAGLFISIVFHELCHSLVARRYGLPMKGITLFIFGGVAEMSEEPPSPKVEFLMAIAGPISSILLALLFLGVAAGSRALGWSVVVSGVFGWAGLINGILAGFNLIPGFPLDGGRVLRSILWHVKGNLRKATQTASQIGSGFGGVLIGLGFLNLLFLNPLGGLWWILIGMFLRGAARHGYQQVLIRQFLQGEPVSRFMSSETVTVPETLSLEQLVEDYIYRYHHKMYPVLAEGRLVGCVTTRQVKEHPREQWAELTVGEVAEKCSKENAVGPNEDALKVLSLMSRTQKSRLLVMEDDQLKGILSLKDLLEFLSLKLELEAEEIKGLRPTGIGLPEE